MSITYQESKGKIVLNKDGVYFSLNKEQVKELMLVLKDIEEGTNKFYKKDNRHF